MSVLPFLAGLIAFLMFALATDRHHRRCFGAPCPSERARLLRGMAWMIVAGAIPLAISAWGFVIGPIAWIGTMMMGAAATFCLFNFGPSPRT